MSMLGATTPVIARDGMPPPVRYEADGDRWAFAAYKAVPITAELQALIDEAGVGDWSPRGCKLKVTGEFDYVPPGTVDLMVVTKHDTILDPPRGLPRTVAHVGLFMCAAPPDDRPFADYRPPENEFGPFEDRDGVQLAGWTSDARHLAVENRFGLNNRLGSFEYQNYDGPSDRDWGYTVRDESGAIVASASFSVTDPGACLATGHNLRFWSVEPEAGLVAAYDLHVPTGNLTACYGSVTTVTADEGTPISDAIDGVPASAAGVEWGSDQTITLRTLFRL